MTTPIRRLIDEAEAQLCHGSRASYWQPIIDAARAEHDNQEEPMPETFDFSKALAHLKHGVKVCRLGWNGKGMWIKLQVPEFHSKMTHPYLYIEYPEGHPAYPCGSKVPWLASQTDLLASDWMVA